MKEKNELENGKLMVLSSLRNMSSNFWVCEQSSQKIDIVIGCHFHGCPKCTCPDALSPNGKLHLYNYEDTMNRVEEIRKWGYTVETVWECEVKNEINRDLAMAEHFNDMCVRGRIDPRDAFFGGITQAFKMIEEADDENEISYFDIISLYPWCNYYGPYPIGHPTIINPKKTRVEWTHPDAIQYRGLIKARIIPPKGLYFPIIPARIPKDQRFLLSLCLKCAKKFSKTNTLKYDEYECPHSDKERVRKFNTLQ